MTIRQFVFAFVSISLAQLFVPTAAAAQSRSPALALELAVGKLLFPDDGVVREGFVGAAGRIAVSPRLSVGPEVAVIRGDNHSHFMLTGNLTFDFRSPRGGQKRYVTPFVVAGAGWFRTSEVFPVGRFTSGDGAFTAGGGVRAHFGPRLFVGGEVRVGWELHLRANALAGVRFQR